jgi:hypothetical protein
MPIDVVTQVGDYIDCLTVVVCEARRKQSIVGEMRPLLTVMAILAASQAMPLASPAASDAVVNLTGLPVYPNLSRAAMDPVARTDALGHWCSRFSAETSYSLDAVEDWYRQSLSAASETDLTHDERYKNAAGLIGIKLALGVDSVTVYRIANQVPTFIELFRCSPIK